MSVDQPQERHDELDDPVRVEGEWDGAAGQDVEPPQELHEEPGHPQSGEAESHVPAGPDAERPTAAATAMPEAEGAGVESTAGEQLTPPANRPAEASPTSPARQSPALSDFMVFGPGELQGYRSRWASIQLGFLDDPKGAAELADAVVSELLGRVAERRETLRDELDRRSDQDVDTESMRLAVRNYRSLFQGLVGS